MLLSRYLHVVLPSTQAMLPFEGFVAEARRRPIYGTYLLPVAAGAAS
jgi:hypothetical protein